MAVCWRLEQASYEKLSVRHEAQRGLEVRRESIDVLAVRRTVELYA